MVDFGYYPAFVRYPGSQHLKAETFIACSRTSSKASSATRSADIAIVNTGVSTEGPVASPCAISSSGTACASPSPTSAPSARRSRGLLQQTLGGHGDEHETSLILAIEPQSVDIAKAVPDYGNMREEPETVFYRPAIFAIDPGRGPDHSLTGVRGDPTLATAEKGRATLSAMIEELVAGLTKLKGRP